MTAPIIKSAFVTGEVTPSLFGHVDLARLHGGASTMRNMFVSYRGGAYSRAGTKFVGFSKQTGRAYPPRLVTFQFSINQGLALEFGNFYMRVISNGGYVTEGPINITNITQARPGVVTAPGAGLLNAAPNIGAVATSYAPGDTVTLAGGVFTTAAVLGIASTTLVNLALNATGSGYAPGDTVFLFGGVQTTTAEVIVSSTQAVSASVAAGGTGGTNGAQVVTGTTGTGTKFQANVVVAGGSITSVTSISLPGNYTVNPAIPSDEPVTGAGLVGAKLSVNLGVLNFAIFNGGVFTTNTATFTQASSSGNGMGATFRLPIYAPAGLNVTTPGFYTTFPTNPVAQASSSGAGTGATFTVGFIPNAPWNNGDWVSIAGVQGMTQINGDIYVIGNVTPTTFSLFDAYGNPIDTTAFSAYVSGGRASRIFTKVSPFSEVDLRYLKWTESADVMSFTCVNPATRTEYIQVDLARITDSNWIFTQVIPAPGIGPPTSVAGVASAVGTVDYAYQVTSINPNDGTESIASPRATVNAAVNLSTTAGTITLTWGPVGGVSEYNIYKASPGFGVPPPEGSLFGFAGITSGNQFIDANIIPDFSQVPPQHVNPFAQGQILNVKATAGGAGYTTVGFTITTSTGSGAVLVGILVGGALSAIIVLDAGRNYRDTDTIVVTGDGAGATATMVVGPISGTYPSVVAYFQERRVYANTLNQPDTYFMSQPGAFTNFDRRSPTIDSDAIIGTPWAVQVNGIQFMVPMPGGLVVFTGLSAWQLSGAGGGSLASQPITPSSQQALPQANNGCNALVGPIKIDNDIIFLQAKGSIYRDLSYQLSSNIYTGADLTIYSSHLFTGFQIIDHAWCEEPHKLMWAVRDDGILLALTFLKPQEVAAWARSDTNGNFKSVCSVTEPPVDALYLAVERFPGGNTAFMIERMDNRIWGTVEDTWCVDCGLTLPLSAPNATLAVSSATGRGACIGITNLISGSGYSAGTTATVVDNNGAGPGTGAVPTLTIVGGFITNVIFFPGSEGSNYVSPKLVISDPTNSGRGASATITLSNNATFSASADVFVAGDVGKVIRMGGGMAEITVFADARTVAANILSPITAILPNSFTNVLPQPAGSWTLAPKVTTISGLRHLAGATVVGIADGNVTNSKVVSADGVITLDIPASAVTVGLGFKAQLQSLYLDTGDPTVQGQRKKVAAVTARIENSRGLQIGANQPDGSTLSPIQIAPVWTNLADVPDDGPNFPAKPYNAVTIPLRTGDIRIPVSGGFATPGQVAIEQENPLPMQVLAFISEALPGDDAQMKAARRSGKGGGEEQ